MDQLESVLSQLNKTSDHPNMTQENATDYAYDYDAGLYEKGDLLYYIVYPILVPVGIIGNSLSFIVLIQLSRSSSFFLYLSILALSDLAFVVVGAMMRWVEVLGDLLFYDDITSYLCSVKFTLVYVFSQFSSWIIVAVTTDRFIAVCFPFKRATYCTKRRALFTALFLFLFISGINLPNICFKWENQVCVYPEITFDYCLKYSIMIDLLAYFVVPVILICVLNILTLRVLYRALIRRRRLVNRQKEGDDCKKSTDENDMKQIMAMLLVVSGVYVITSLPMAYGSMMAWAEDQQIVETEYTYLMNVILELSNTINHSINFILYGISGATFRKKVIQMLCCCCRRQWNGRSGVKKIAKEKSNLSQEDSNKAQKIANIAIDEI